VLQDVLQAVLFAEQFRALLLQPFFLVLVFVDQVGHYFVMSFNFLEVFILLLGRRLPLHLSEIDHVEIDQGDEDTLCKHLADEGLISCQVNDQLEESGNSQCEFLHTDFQR